MSPGRGSAKRYFSSFGLLSAATVLLAGLRLPQELPRRSLVEDWRIGGPDGEGPTAFSSEPWVVVDRRGNAHTRGRGDSQLAVFDSAGRFVRSVGRRGQGPGEFTVISGHGFVGDTLWATNWPNAAVSTFTLDGSHLVTRRIVVELAQRFGSPIGISALVDDGRAIVIPDGAPVGEGGRRMVPVITGDRDMRVTDTLVTMLRPASMVVDGVGTFWIAPVPIPRLIDIAPDGDGLVVVNWERDGSEVEVQRLASGGRVTWQRTVSLSSTPIAGRIRDSIVNRAVEMATGQIDIARRRGAIPPGVRTRPLVESSLDLPARWPPVKDVVLGIDGSVWLQRGDPGLPNRWVVLDSGGAPAFEVSTHLPLTIREADRDAIWATFSDDDGFPYLVRYRAIPSGSPGRPPGNGR